MSRRMQNALTIDLEDYYHVTAFRDSISPELWISQPSRAERNTLLLLDLLDEVGCKATFFTLGSLAERHPHVVRQVAERGHEIACHSLRHRIVFEMTPDEFREDTRQAKRLIEDCSGAPVKGYRAPSFSITKNSLWALEILAELGFTYDSSIFPVSHPSYGLPGFSRDPRRIETSSGPIVEYPLSTLELAGRRSPFGGGAYFRLLPYGFTRWGINYLNRHENRAACVYLHPWELDSEQPKMKGPLTSRLRHYFGLRNASTKFRSLLRDFEFCPLSVLVSRV
jgi:polysaccharide deacetylase family protein (PEP-CTERM system associated)